MTGDQGDPLTTTRVPPSKLGGALPDTGTNCMLTAVHESGGGRSTKGGQKVGVQCRNELWHALHGFALKNLCTAHNT